MKTLLLLPLLITKWRKHAKEAARDLGVAIGCASRTRLATESRILERCARQLEQQLQKRTAKSKLVLILPLLLLAFSAQSQRAWLDVGEYVIEERTRNPNRVERRNSESLGNDVLVQRNVVFRYGESGSALEVLETTYVSRRLGPEHFAFRCESVVEMKHDPRSSVGRVYHSWPPERVARLSLRVPACSFVGRNEQRTANVRVIRAGHCSWAMKISRATFPVLAMPDVGTNIFATIWRVEGVDKWTPTVNELPAAWQAPFTIGAASIAPPNEQR